MTTVRPHIAAVGIALLVALLVPAAWSAAIIDLLTPPASRADARVVVIAFDDRDPESYGLPPIAHRRGIYLRDLTVQADRAHAAAVTYVGFDSLTLREGPADRQAVAESERIQRLGIAPLLEMALSGRPGQVPLAQRYRVDDLATQFAGIGLPLVTDAPTVRTVPEVARVPTLEPGALVRGDEPDATLSIVLGLAARSLVADLALAPATPPSADRLDLGGRAVPLEGGRLRIHWSDQLDSGDDPAVIPAGRLLGPGSASGPPDWTGRTVLIGTIDPAHTPYYDTPIGPMPELLIHANALNTLLTEEYLRPVAGQVALLTSILLAGAVAAVWYRNRRLGAVIGIVAAGGWVALVRILAGQGWLIDPLRPTVAALATVAALGVVALVQQLLQRRRLAKLFSEYVPPGIARDLVDSGRAETAQAGERLLVTVLFCDLRGFTPIAAKLAPTDVRALLDHYYEALSPIVFDQGGTVLQYTGDEIFAVFGAPLPRSDHADAALRCADAMHGARPELNDALGRLDLPQVGYGISLHTGLVVAAHVGSTIRRQYSIIGDPVNVGSRLCAKASTGSTVFSQSTRDHLDGDPLAEDLGPVSLKGIDEPVTIYRTAATPTVRLNP